MPDRFARIETEIETIGRLSLGDEVVAHGTDVTVEGQVVKLIRSTNFMGSSPFVIVAVRTADGGEPEFYSHQVEKKG